MAKTIEAAVSKAMASNDLERVIVDCAVQEKAIAFPTDSRLLHVAWHYDRTGSKDWKATRCTQCSVLPATTCTD